MLGPTKARFILHELISRIPLFRNYEDSSFLLVKIKRNRTLFRNRSGIKSVREKIGFLEIYLENEVSKIIRKLEF